MKISFVETHTERGLVYNIYHLKVEGLPDGQPEKLILVADLREMGGGMRMLKSLVHQPDGRTIISVYLEVSIMGHDLDQWVHYDLETGERILDKAFDPR